MLYDNGHGAWLAGQIVFNPIKRAKGRVVWLLRTRYGYKLLQDRHLMAVDLHIWIDVWWQEKQVVSAATPNHFTDSPR